MKLQNDLSTMPGQMVLVPTDSLYKYISPTRVERGIKIYEFKVSLRNISPKVERQILVQGDYTLEQLGRVAACAIGWDRGRFNLTGPDGEFIKGYRPWCDDSESDSESCADEPKESKIIFVTKTIFVYSFVYLEKAKARTAREIYISEQFNRQNKTLVMNFGKDGWIHDIKFVKTQDRDLKLYPKCIGGKCFFCSQTN